MSNVIHSSLPLRTPTSGIDVVTTLAHFAIVTYAVEPAALRKHVHERFELDCITRSDGTRQALISVVPFLDLDFRLAAVPWPKWRFGQTNYRAYVTDSETGEHMAWFFGTSLDTPFVIVPRSAWRLPWHRGRIEFDVTYDQELGRHTSYRMSTRSAWAPAELELTDSGEPVTQLEGFADLQAGMQLLTHPMQGAFYRSDGRLGGYRIWHERMQPTLGHATRASFPLLERLGLVADGELERIHSVMMQPAIDFTIYLPPVLF